MKKFALVGALALAACTPDIPKDAPADHAIVAFDPAAATPVVPSPNDLAIDPTTGKVHAPVDPNSPPANQEFLNEYLNTLDGFPLESTATALIQNGDLDPATVNASSVLVNDLTAAATGGNPAVAATAQYDAATHQIVIAPPNGAWARGHKFEVVVVSSANSGIQLANGGGQVFASPVWAFARSATPLVTCEGTVCHSNLSAVSDVAQAQQLEHLRQGYAPLLDALAANGVPREAVALLWTFTTTTHPEMRFDPAGSVIPFPNDLVTDPATGNVKLPAPTLPDGGVDTGLQGQLIAGLNTLDGFSTTAPIVSENDPVAPALVGDATIDVTSLSETSVGFVPLFATTNPDVKFCVLPQMPGCASTTAQPDGTYAMPDGGAVPQQLQIIPQAPLDEQSTYGSFVTTELKSTDGKTVLPTTAFALFRMKNSLVDAEGHSTVSLVSDAQAQQIEPARAALKPFFDQAEEFGIPRSSLALAWTFHTQSEQSVLNTLNGYPAIIGLPTDPVTLVETPGLLTCGGTCAYPVTGIGHAFSGTIASALALGGQGGTLDPTHPVIHTIPFILTLPTGTPPATGWPVVMFGHGLQGNRLQAMAFASSLAQGGFAMIAIDEVWHGERTTCTGLGNFASALEGQPAGTFNDSVACNNTNVCDEGFPIGHCVKGPATTDLGDACTFGAPGSAAGTGGDLFCQGAGQGQCRPTADGQPGPSFCDGADWKRDTSGQPAALGVVGISGWNLFNLSNLFATRDNFRQQVIDDSQLARVLKDGTDATGINAQLSGALSAAGTYLDGAKIHYAGQSLGGILGTLYTASDPNIHKSLLNVPAGDLLGVFLTTPNPDLGALRTGFISTLASQGIAYGTPAFDNFAGIAKWILDPADPVNSGHSLTHGANLPADRQVFIQFIENDHLLPNPTTEELIASAIRTNMGEMTCANGQPAPCVDVFEFTEADFGSYMTSNLDDRHGFLLNGKSPALTGFGQEQAVQFFATGTIKTTFP